MTVSVRVFTTCMPATRTKGSAATNHSLPLVSRSTVRTSAGLLNRQNSTPHSSAAQVAYLHKTLTKQRDDAVSLKEKLDRVKPQGKRLKADYDEMADKIERSKGSLSAAEYNKLANQANRLGKKYNRAVQEHNELVARLNQAAEIMTYVIEHPDDRRDVYKWVRSRLKD